MKENLLGIDFKKKTLLTYPRSPQHQRINVRDNRSYPNTKKLVRINIEMNKVAIFKATSTEMGLILWSIRGRHKK